MKRGIKVFVLLIFILLPVLSIAKEYVEGEVLVKYKKSVKIQRIREIMERHKLEKVQEFRELRIHRLRIPKGKSVKEFVEKLKKEKDVEYAEPNYLRKPLLLPNDKDFSRQWNLVKIRLPEAWDIERGSREILIAVLDTGVDYTHPDLKGNMWKNPGEIPDNGRDDDGNGFVDDVHGYDFCSQYGPTGCEGEDNDPMDTNGHGTFVAGIIGAIANNLTGIAGINHKVTILPVKFMESAGDVAAEIAAIRYAVKMGARIINASYGDITYSQAERDVIQELSEKGILFVCAAGNGGWDLERTPLYPAAYGLPNMIVVGSVTRDDKLSQFSNYSSSVVHIAAPGGENTALPEEGIYSTVPQAASRYETAYIKVSNSKYKAYGIEFSGITEGITADLVFCGRGKKSEIPDSVRGKIALIERGDIQFREKILNAMEKGAVGAIVYDNVDSSLPFQGTLVTEGDYIPAVSVTRATGQMLMQMLELSTGPVTLVNYPFHTVAGTSAAAPHVSGCAGLLLSLRPTADVYKVKDAILSSADRIPSLADKIQEGRRLNAQNALLAIRSSMRYEFKIELKRGWNFVSFPVDLDDPAVLRVFGGAEPKVIFAYDPKEKRWVRFLRGGHSELSSLESKRGYWIYVEAEMTLNLLGEKPEKKIRLFNGWNLIGYNGDEDVEVDELLRALGSKWVILWNWDEGEWYAKANGYSVPFKTIDRFSKGKAYWILIRGVPEEGIEWEQG